MLVVFAIQPFFSTLFGGLAAMRLRHRLHPFMALAAGILVATALGNLLPESGALMGSDSPALRAGVAAVAGFLFFSSIEAGVHRRAWEHEHRADGLADDTHGRSSGALGVMAPTWLIVHSTLDGVAIGLGFQAGGSVGLLVGLAVLAHDFADGMNVVTLTSVGGGGRRTAQLLLALDALAPPAGALASNLVAPPAGVLGPLLGVFGGVFLAIGAGHLLPEAQHQRPADAPGLMVLVALGAVVVFAIRVVLG